MTSQLPGNLATIHAEIARQQRHVVPPQRISDARALLDTLAIQDPWFRNRTPEESEVERVRLAKRLDRLNLTLGQLSEGLDRAYSGIKRPDNPIGAVIEAARGVRREQNQGQVVRELQAIPAAPPAKGPVLAAYGTTVNHDCPRCGAVAGSPCIHPDDGRGRFVPCMARRRVT